MVSTVEHKNMMGIKGTVPNNVQVRYKASFTRILRIIYFFQQKCFLISE